MTCTLLEKFTTGQEVPGWLLSAEPSDEISQNPSIKFLIDCILVNVCGSNWLLPANICDYTRESSFIKVYGGVNVRLSAGVSYAMPITVEIMTAA